ncbi:MAG: hypothetical protein LC643_05000 [Bacteroidales bacterium]|nr:hypothetical protein [Bacteroidales bacterium]
MTHQPTLSLHLSLEEVNTILNALGGLPYMQVYALIQKVQGQAEAQLKQENEQAAPPEKHNPDHDQSTNR